MVINPLGRWTKETILARCGHATITPGGSVTAGEIGNWTIVFTAGEYGMDIGSTVKLVWRLASDWGQPQFTMPDQMNYTTVQTSNNAAVIKARFDPKGHERPWSASLILDITEEALNPGDTISINLGDRSDGSPGMQAQTFIDETFAFRVFVDPFATGCFLQQPDELTLPIQPGPVDRFSVVGPGSAVPGSRINLTVRVMDVWGNPVESYNDSLKLIGPDGEDEVAVPFDGYAATKITRPVHTLGVARFTLVDATGKVLAQSNPILCQSGEMNHQLYWGDIHGQTGETVGTGTVDRYFAFAKDIARLDFAAHAANDFQVTNDHYHDIQKQVKIYHDPGRFVTFLAFEWSGNTPAGGDHNVYFLHDNEPIHRSSHWQINDWYDSDTDCHPITAIYATYRGRDDVFVIPHVGGRRANLAFHDPHLSPFIEICSVHGRFEWFARDALARGLEVGFVANSDDHTGRPGAAFASERHRVQGGLMGAWADNLSREALWEAFRARRVYGTSGKRIALQFTADGHPMGESYTTSTPPHLRVAAWGTDAIERVEIWRGCDLWYVHHPSPGSPSSGRLRLTWSGARSSGRNRRLIWDGALITFNATIGGAEAFGFDNPREGVVEVTENCVRWTSSTVGDPDGLIVSVQSLGSDARIRFETPALTTDIALAEIGVDGLRIPGTGLDAELRVAWMPDTPFSKDIVIDLIGSAPVNDVVPYWVRILQVDGEAAWSSPIYVHRAK